MGLNLIMSVKSAAHVAQLLVLSPAMPLVEAPVCARTGLLLHYQSLETVFPFLEMACRKRTKEFVLNGFVCGFFCGSQISPRASAVL